MCVSFFMMNFRIDATVGDAVSDEVTDVSDSGSRPGYQFDMLTLENTRRTGNVESGVFTLVLDTSMVRLSFDYEK
jgi:hypothetical protein